MKFALYKFQNIGIIIIIVIHNERTFYLFFFHKLLVDWQVAGEEIKENQL